MMPGVAETLGRISPTCLKRGSGRPAGTSAACGCDRIAADIVETLKTMSRVLKALSQR